MAVTTVTVLAVQNRSNRTITSQARQLPAKVRGIQFQATDCSNFTQASQQLTMSVYNGPTNAGPWTLMAEAKGVGGSTRDKAGNIVGPGLVLSADDTDEGGWWRGEVTVVGTVRFGIDATVTTADN